MLDRILTIAIGDIRADGRPLSDELWLFFQDAILDALKGADVVAHATGYGVTSDQGTETAEQTAVFVAVCNEVAIDPIRRQVARVLRRFEASSACFAVDHRHEPVFPTHDGYRPPVEASKVTAADYRPTHGGYPEPF